MTKLWKALAILAQDAAFRQQVQAVCAMVDRPDLADKPIDLRKQPNMQSLAQISQLFLKKADLHLCAYELSEINRWLWQDTNLFQGKSMAALDAYWTALKAPPDPSPAFLEAAGALALDSGVRFLLAQNGTTFADQGFTELNTDEQGYLLRALQPGGIADNKAKEFFAFSWSGPHCGAIIKAYPGWIHLNA